ncbi:MAG: response regulator, partial [Chloroflexi bacterium]|nr:response regulator [Chloroflexota bacterium]
MVDQQLFSRYIQEVLPRLHDRSFLVSHPLARLLSPSGLPPYADALRRRLLDAIEGVKPSQPGPTHQASWRRYHQLRLRYVDGKGFLETAKELGISPRQASRDHWQAIQAVAVLLWSQYAVASAIGDQRVVAEDRDEAVTTGDPVDSGLEPGLERELRHLIAAGTGVEAPTDVEETVRGAAAILEPLAASRGVALEVSFPDTLSPVVVGRTLLRQALINIISFCIKRNAQARVTISGADTSRGVIVRLQVRPRQRNGPVSGSTTDVSSDLETLLAVGRRLLAEQGGVVELGMESSGEPAVSLLLPSAQLLSVLVVDDNPDIIRLFRRYLADARNGTGYRLIQASTGEGAVELALEMKPDVIILDVMMPSQDGWEILQRLRGHEGTRRIPVVVCSILPEKDLALSLGVQDFLLKPVTRSGLLAVLERCLG